MVAVSQSSTTLCTSSAITGFSCNLLRQTSGTLVSWCNTQFEITGLAQACKGQEIKSTATYTQGPCKQGEEEGELLGGCVPLGKPSLCPKLQRNERWKLVSAWMGQLVPPTPKEEEGKRKGQSKEGQKRRRSLQAIRCNWRALGKLFFIATAVFGTGVHAGVHQHGSGAEHGDPAQVTETHSLCGEGHETEPQGSTTTIESPSQCPDEDRQQGKSAGKGRRSLELLDQGGEGGGGQREEQTRRDAAQTQQGARGIAKGGRNDQNEGRRGHPVGARVRRCDARTGEHPGGQGRQEEQSGGEAQGRRDDGTETTRHEVPTGVRISNEARAAESAAGAAMPDDVGATEEGGCHRPRGGSASRRRPIQEGDATDYSCRRYIWSAQRSSQEDRIPLHEAGQQGDKPADGGEDDGGKTYEAAGSRHRDLNHSERQGDCSRDEFTGSGGLGALSATLTYDLWEPISTFVTGLLIDFVVFVAIVMGIIVMHKEKQLEAVVIGGRRYFRKERTEMVKYNKNGIFFLTLLAVQYGAMASELSVIGQDGSFQVNQYEEHSDSVLMQQAGRPAPSSNQGALAGEGVEEDQEEEVTIDIHVYMRTSAYNHLRSSDYFGGANSFQNTYAAIEEANGFQYGEVIAAHEVLHPPAHLAALRNSQVYIAELRRDAPQRLTSDDVLCLFSIEIQNPGRLYDVQSKLKVQWASKWLNRDDILHFVRVSELCRMRAHTVTCMVWINGRFLEEDSSARHEMEDADFIRILVQSPTHKTVNEIMCSLQEAERIQRARTFYQDTSSSSEETEEPQRDGESSESEREERVLPSRSRSRPRDDPEEVELLQVALRFIRRKGRELRTDWSLGNEEDSTREPRSGENPSNAANLTFCRSSVENLPPPGNPGDEGAKAIVISLSDELFGQDIQCISDSDKEQQGEDEQEGRREVELRIPEEHFDFYRLLAPWKGEDNGLSLDLPDQASLCPVAMQFLSGCVEGGRQRVKEIHIYTDGSFHPPAGVAAYAFAVFGYDPEQKPMHFFLGWSGDRVRNSMEDEKYIGAEKQSSEEAEASGMVWAHLWLLQDQCPCNATIHYDALTVGNALQGIWNTRPGWPLGQRLRDVALLAKAAKRISTISYEHCKAHTGQPCNEIVDGLAKSLATDQGGQEVWNKAEQVSDLFVSEAEKLQWAWWHLEVLFNPGLPKWDNGAINIEGPKYSAEGGVESIENRNQKPNQVIDYNLKVASYNVMTLHSSDDDGRIQSESGRSAFLRTQLAYLGINVIGIQESRAPRDIILSTPDYIRVVAGGSGGIGNHHGCELWLSTVQPLGYSGKHPIHFDRKLLTVIYKSPRLLAVNVNLHGEKLQFVVAHAPHDNANVDEKEEWWNTLTTHISNWKGKCRMVLMGDFNARLQNTCEGRIGERVSQGVHSDNGERLEETIREMELIAPSTFSSYHTGVDWTWTHPRGSHARLDYVLLQEDGGWNIGKSYVEPDIITSTAAHDHEAVVLEVGWQYVKGAIIPRYPQYDWAEMATEQGQRKLRSAVEKIVEPDWSMDVHCHWQQLEDQLHQTLLENFPQGKRPTRSDIFSTETWDLEAKEAQCQESIRETRCNGR